MSTTLPYPLACARGQTWVQPFTATDPSGTTAEPVDITGRAVRFTVRGLLDPTPLLVLDTAAGGVVVTSPTQGNYTVTMTGPQTAALPDRCWYYVDFTDAGAEGPLQRGPLAVRQSGA